MRLLSLVALCILLCAAPALHVEAQSAARAAAREASIRIDANKVENRISPLLYGQFLEFMYEGMKFGLHAELLRDRGFEEAPNALGLPRHWERYPDDRNDDYGLAFKWDDSAHYPPRRNLKVETGEKIVPEHSLRVDAGDGVIARHGFFQPRVPVRAGVVYHGSLWLKSEGYSGGVMLALESDVNLGETYAESK